MINQGRILIGLIMLVAFLSAGFSWIHQYRQGRRSLEFWGSENAMLIRHAPHVELLKLTPTNSPLKKSFDQKPGATAGLSSSVNHEERSTAGQAGSGTRLIQQSAKKIPADSPQELIAGRELAIVNTLDISEARGLVHARQALIEDASFQWEKTRGECAQQWDYALRFFEGERQVILLFDFSCQRVQPLGIDRDLSMAPIAQGMLLFLKELLPTT